MANDDIINPKKLDSYFWLRAETGDVLLKKDNKPLSKLIEEHPTFQFGSENEPYLEEKHFNTSDKWNIPFWPQKPSLVLNDRDELEDLINALSIGWTGYEKTLSFRGAAIQLDHQDHISRLKLTFNGEGQRVYDDFSDYMSARMANVNFATKPNPQAIPYLGLAKKHDADEISKVRTAFSSTIERRFSALKTEEIAVNSLTLGQVLCSSSDHSKGRRDIVKIYSNGRIEWLFDGNPFNNRENYKLVNPNKSLAPA